MSTDLITVKEPTVIKSYDQLAQTVGMRPLFCGQCDDYKFFEEAKKNTGAYRLWKKKVLEEKSNWMMASTMDGGGEMISEFADMNRTSFVLMKVFVEILRLYTCSQHAVKKICTYLTTDPDQPFNEIYGLLVREEFKSTDSYKKRVKPL